MESCAHIDVETYSEAGYVWSNVAGKWWRPPGRREYGLPAVGAAVYAEHPSTEILCMSYYVPERTERVETWSPEQPFPPALAQWVAEGRPVKAHNVMFERLIWHHVGLRMGWPHIHPSQWRCSMATARVNGLPASLDKLGAALGLDIVKDKRGKQLIKLLCCPRNPTKLDSRRRILPSEDFDASAELYAYCEQDVRAEMAASAAMPGMSTDELAFWQYDQEINWRGVVVDVESVHRLITVLEQCLERYGAECEMLTGGLLPSQGAKLMGWLAGQGVHTDSLDAEHLSDLLSSDLAPLPHRVLELKAATASASVKKLYALRAMTSADGRLRNLYSHHGARTGRPTGADVQPTNLPKAGPALRWDSLGMPFGQHLEASPWTLELADTCKAGKWSHEAVEAVLHTARAGGFEMVERVFGDALLAISGCVRGLFVAAPGHDFIASDFSAIEAVVAACSAGEQWRIDTFRRGEDIYLASIASITGRPVSYYLDYVREHGQHHSDRQDGKIAELASGYGGWIGAWRAFGAEGTDEELRSRIVAWRAASPAIVEMWGGQGRGWPGSRSYHQEFFGIEGIAIQALTYPGRTFTYRQVSMVAEGGHLFMILPSGRRLTYRSAMLVPNDRRWGEQSIRFLTWNSNAKYGASGWVWMDTYGPRLFENYVQAVAHDIQRFSILNQWRAGYRTVLHVYDENVAEVPEGWGSVEEFEAIMSTMPPWAADWPIKASGGYRAKRYRKG